VPCELTRYKSAILASETREEAPVKLSGWMKQRTRWMKGWMQTFIVHNRNPRQFLKDTGWKSFLTFELYIGGLILAPLLHTLFVITAIVRLLVPDLAVEDGGPMGVFNNVVLATGYFAAVAIVFRGLWQRGEKRLLGHQILLPLYWLLHSIATAKALVELIHKPHFWAKTTHGQTSVARETGTANKPRLQLQASTENNLRRPYTYLKE
jgi:cellulose synthase/poly-beta-1,6-N-acetylglucosamine synthase-like glycosyltransferase